MRINVDFLFAEDVKRLMERNDVTSIPNYMKKVNGATCIDGRFSFINLNAERWKEDFKRGGDAAVIKELCVVIVHELIHQEIETRTYTSKHYNKEGEERVCLLMAGQQKMRSEV